ncbi:hypothetical protein [Tunicatimonas pelagia]|uniref:hypothetical protein n=1 Tax=Tunicatimonas pelagia TaxID=931531 RepID=UPI002666F868|nr:hypothetical protein [Tunicatimonas pelagia]WKN44242.1 hypothetical protein P0M28_04585 [Tunicatimonas pelagia]
MFEASYQIAHITDHFVLIVDLDEGRSVTTDAERVVADLYSAIEGGLRSRRIYYRDTEGRFDELRHQGGRFLGYAPCTNSQQDFLASLLDNSSPKAPTLS